MQKRSLSLLEDPLLNDLNLLTRLLFLLVIFKKVFSMSNLENALLTFYFPRNQKNTFSLLINIQDVT